MADEFQSLAVAGAALFLPPMALVAFSARLRPIAGVTLSIALSAHYFLFHAASALLYGAVAPGVLRLVLVSAFSIAICAVLASHRVSEALAALPVVSPRAFIVACLLAVASIGTDVWIFSLQGFSFADGLSRFAAPFVGDHWRHTAIVAGILREDQAIFFPGTKLVYQVLWHHGVASVLGALPAAPTLFKYELGATLYTGFLFYLMLYWTVLALAAALARRWWALLLVFALAATDADAYNAVWSYVQRGHVAIAADSSSQVATPFRYFSLKLVSLTAPQHAAFFVFAAILVVALKASVGRIDKEEEWRAPFVTATVSAVAAAVFSPVLAVLLYPFLFCAVLVRVWRRPRVLGWMAAAALLAALATAALHWVVLRFPVWDLFLRPNLTGGGSGSYGLQILPVLNLKSGLLAGIPGSLVAMLGVTGVVLSVGILWALVSRRSVFCDTLALALAAGLVFWNLLVVDTEIQRHSSMLAAFLAVVLIGAYLPVDGAWRMPLAAACVLAAVACAVLNRYLVVAYTHNARFMPLTSAWSDYFCMNDVLRRHHPGLAVVAATPRHFELPITVEAAPTLVWSQVAAVHQRITPQQAQVLDRINPRDWATFRATGEREGAKLVETLRALGYRAVVWGPTEEKEWGPVLAGLLAAPQRYLSSCGFVGLFSLDAEGGKGSPDDYRAFRARLDELPERLISREAPGTVKIVSPSGRIGPSGPNIAKGARAWQSSASPGANASFATDGQVGEANAPVTFTRNEFLPWWEMDLGREASLAAIRIHTLQLPAAPQYELRDIYVLVSNERLRARSPLTAFRAQGAKLFFVLGRSQGSVEIPIARKGRFIRIQASDQRHLVLAEVEAYEAKPVDGRK